MSLEIKLKDLEVLPRLLEETQQNEDGSVTFTISPVKSISDSESIDELSTTEEEKETVEESTESDSESEVVEGGKKKSKRSKKNGRKMRGGDFSATETLLNDIVMEGGAVELDRMLETTVEASQKAEQSTNKVISAVDSITSPLANIYKSVKNGVVNVAKKFTDMSATEEDNVLEEQEKQDKQYCGGYDIDEILEAPESETEDSDLEEIEGGNDNDFASFIKNLYGGIKATKGGKKRVYSPEATEINNKITEVIKKVYPEITKEELKAVRFVLYQPIRAKYEPEVFKTLSDVEKSKMLLKATTEKAVKEIDLVKAVADRKAKLEEIFGKKEGEQTITPDGNDEEKKEKKEKKTKKSTKKAQRGGFDDSETIELPHGLMGGCNCGH